MRYLPIEFVLVKVIISSGEIAVGGFQHRLECVPPAFVEKWGLEATGSGTVSPHLSHAHLHSLKNSLAAIGLLG